MSFESRLQLIQHLDSLIKRKFKGSSADYAGKLGVSSSTFFRLLNHIREEYGVGIDYNLIEACYQYDQEGTLYFGFLPAHVVPQAKIQSLRVGDG